MLTGMAGLLCVLSVLVLWLLHKKWPRWRKWWVVSLVTILFSCSFAATALGGWTARLLRWIIGVPAHWMGLGAGLLAAVLVLVFIPAVIYGFVHDKKADKWEMTGLILLPLLFIIASGPVAAHGGNLVDAIAHFGSGGLSYLVRA